MYVIDHFNTRLMTTLNYSAIADFHTLQITAAHAKTFQSAVCALVMALNDGDFSTALTKSSLHRLPYNSLSTLSVTTLMNFKSKSKSKSKSHCD
jgi:hypothetical protein